MKNEHQSKNYTIWNYLLYLLVGGFVKLTLKLVFGFKLNADNQVKAWKKEGKSFVVLCAHPSEFDATIMLSAVLPNKVRFVAGAQQLYKGVQGAFLRGLGVIPKKQFVPDISSIKEMMTTVKSGMILGFMPEGRVSLDGTENPNDISTAKLVKKLGVSVAILKPQGSFFVKPSYNWSALIKGPVSAELSCFLTAEEVEALSPDEILSRLDKECKYNESEALRGSGKIYGKKNAPAMERVSNIMYRCPCCGSLYTIVDNRCRKCNLEIIPGSDMFFDFPSTNSDELPDNVAAWNKMQLDFEKSFWADENARIEFDVQKYMLTLKKETEFRLAGDGFLSLDKNGLHYKDKDETIDVPLGILPGVSADYMNGYITYYSGDDIRRFALKNAQYAARFVNSLMVLKGLK